MSPKSLLYVADVEWHDVDFTVEIGAPSSRVENDSPVKTCCTYLLDEEKSSVEDIVIDRTRIDVIVANHEIGRLGRELLDCLRLCFCNSDTVAAVTEKTFPSVAKLHLVFHDQCVHSYSLCFAEGSLA